MIINSQVIDNLRNEYGEAFYLLDSEQFEKNFCELKKVFSDIYPNFNIAYSYKTNYTPKLCKIVNKLGGYAEVVSEMEMELALKCGVDTRRIIWNGPVKAENIVKKFLDEGGTVNIDSIDELEYISQIENNYDHDINIGIRCNYDVTDDVISRFGFDVNGQDFVKALDIINKSKNMKLINFQCHFAKRSVDYWPARAKGMIQILERFGITPERIDIGGGIFGKMPEVLKKQFSSEIPMYEDYANAAATVFAEYFSDKEYKPELIVEPGTALVGDCMKFVGTVKTIKNVRGKYFATVLGSQKNINMSGVNPPIEVISLSEGEEYSAIDIVGYTCIEGDVLYKDYSGTLAKGDAIVFSNCGSYSIVMKPPFILPNFPILDICGKTTEVIKRAECFEDIFATYNF